MSTAKKIPAGPARDRILEVASDLFYRQGYRATGINEVIEKSGVAKATFYNHFPSKDELYEASLNAKRDYELSTIDGIIHKHTDPRDKLVNILKWLIKWAKDTEFRGCAFLHAASEVPDPKSKIRKVGIGLYEGIRKRVDKVAIELIESDRKKYKQLDAKTVTNDFMVAFTAAVSLAEIYHSVSPIEQAIDSFERLIGK